MVGDACGVGITAGVDVDSVSGILHPSLLSKKSSMYVCMYGCMDVCISAMPTIFS